MGEKCMKRKTVTVTIDRPLGSYHPKHKNLFYPVNYGYVKDVVGGDGEEQDAYVLGVSEAVSEFTGEVIAVIIRENDEEDKWVVVPEGVRFTEKEIAELTYFQERYFKIRIEMLT
jgi:inorganic pyrophosphatase